MTDDLPREEVIAQIDRMIASPDFSAGPRVGKFLAHLVKEELDGRGDRLKGTAIAMDLFGRGTDFDPGADPVVRTEAIKLRKAIEHYYLTAGASDAIVVSVPKGHYRPTFARRQTPEAVPEKPVRTGLPVLAILRFEGSSDEKALLYREGLPEEIGLELARFGQIRVISGWYAQSDIEASSFTGPAAEADYVLRGNVREAGGNLRISVQLNRLPGETLVWSDRFRIAADADDPFDVQESIARACAIRLADAYGAVAEDLSAQYSGRRAEDAGVFEALLAFHAHMRTSRRASLLEFTQMAEDAVRDNPSSGLAHALAAIALIEAVTLGERPIAEILEPGRSHAEMAIALAPNCQEALFAAACFAQARGDATRYRVLIKRAVATNPNGTLLTAMAGSWYARAGDANEGLALVVDARARNPLLPSWTAISLAIKPLIDGDFQKASSMVQAVDARDSVYEWLLIATAHALAGSPDLARDALAIFERMKIDPADYADSIPSDPVLKQRISDALELLSGA